VGRKSRGALTAILLGGSIAATIDLGAACLISGHDLTYILHVVAGGLLGRRAFSGGTQTALLGLLLQELMGVIIAAIYVGAAGLMPLLKRRWLVCGLLYGVVIFVVMNYVVVPLSAWRHWPTFSTAKFLENLAAMLLFGVIVAFFARRVR
jgi:hypothetical protein